MTTTITKIEAKNLLKRRYELLVALQQLENNCKHSEKVNIIYENGKENISNTINDIDKELLIYSKSSPVGEWLLQIKGMLPYMAATLLSYFNIDGKECAAQFISYAGVDTMHKPHADIGSTLNLIRDSFKKHPDSLYKKVYRDKYIELLDNKLEVDTARFRANRYMLKTFISHLFEEMYRESHNGELPVRYNDGDAFVIEPEVPYTK